MKYILLICSLLTSLAFADQNPTTQTSTEKQLDCATLKGASLAILALKSGNTNRYLNADGHLAIFEINTSRQDTLTRELRTLANEIKTDQAKQAITNSIDMLAATVRHGTGDAYYWSSMVGLQRRQYDAVYTTLTNFLTIYCVQ